MFCPSGLLTSPRAVFKVIANAKERFRSDICHGALLVYTEKAYCASTEPNTKVLPNYFRISFYSAVCLSSKPVHCTQCDVPEGAFPEEPLDGWCRSQGGLEENILEQGSDDFLLGHF